VVRDNLAYVPPSPEIELAKAKKLMWIVDSKNLPGITMQSDYQQDPHFYPDCEEWGVRNGGYLHTWSPVDERGASNDGHIWSPNLCQLTIDLDETSVRDRDGHLPATVPAGGDTAQTILSDPLPDSLPVTVFQLTTGKSAQHSADTPAIPLR